MKNLLYILIALVLTTGNAISKVQAPNEPASDLTANILLPLDDTHIIKLAGVYWLPDYLGGNAGYSERNNEGGKNEVSAVCNRQKPDTSIYDFTTTMEKGFICYHPKCKAKFRYNSSNCSGEYQVSGASCGGDFVNCVGKPCSAGGHYDQTQTNKKCTPVAYGGKTCQSCYTPSCSEGGYQSGSSKTGYICSATAYYGQTCYACAQDPCYGLTEPTQPYGCESYFGQCSSKCEVAYADNCLNRTAVATPYGCESYFEDCPSKCEVAYADNCRNRVEKSCEFGCASKFGDCASKCETCKGDPDCDVTSQSCKYGCETTNSCDKCTKCYADNCRNRTAVATPHGCMSFFGDCTSKCEVPWPDGCRNRTAVNVPANGYCSTSFADCAAKCADWGCNSGYNKSGNSCVAACVYENTCLGYNLTSEEVDEGDTYYDGVWISKSYDSCTACGITKYKEDCYSSRDYSTCIQQDCDFEYNCFNDMDYCYQKRGYCEQCCSDCPGSNCLHIY